MAQNQIPDYHADEEFKGPTHAKASDFAKGAIQIPIDAADFDMKPDNFFNSNPKMSNCHESSESKMMDK